MKNILIGIMCMLLVGCGTTSCPKPIATISDQTSLVLNDSQFQCGPRPSNIPSDAVLKTWEAADISNMAMTYWMWGEKCDKQLHWNKLYFECFKKIQSSCDALDKLNNPKVAPKH